MLFKLSCSLQEQFGSLSEQSPFDSVSFLGHNPGQVRSGKKCYNAAFWERRLSVFVGLGLTGGPGWIRSPSILR